MLSIMGGTPKFKSLTLNLAGGVQRLHQEIFGKPNTIIKNCCKSEPDVVIKLVLIKKTCVHITVSGNM